MQTAKAAWIERLPEHRGDWLGWLIALDQHDLTKNLAFCSALSANALSCAGVAASANAIAAGACWQRVGPPVRKQASDRRETSRRTNASRSPRGRQSRQRDRHDALRQPIEKATRVETPVA